MGHHSVTKFTVEIKKFLLSTIAKMADGKLSLKVSSYKIIASGNGRKFGTIRLMPGAYIRLDLLMRLVASR